MTNHEFHFEFIKGQHHYQRGGKNEDLQSPASRAGWEAEKFQHEKKTKKCESNQPIVKTPEAVYSVGNWGKDSLPITNCKLPIV